MDAAGQKVRVNRTPLKVKTYKKFLIFEDATTSYSLELNKFNDFGYYFGIHKSWKKLDSDQWKHANSINLPIGQWKNFLNVILPTSIAIGMYIEVFF